ncbi:MAG: rod shape-determining protein MreC [Flavobacteriales bacterium CG_4_9_14_0_2_um_filter_35_242]|nr:MAG: rod shape-determining protein MreC [Flavobacteriaceae bacterium CG1_02_35_72]PIR14357.1 MAG: rod shape-determining protein MreC [Flavobacteriales bacterium CG11_big_fil_rev_8_21_14_0_20_35_7]PIV16767.1 MAG: rod shape-determining protein MreC [Flavobacteriales bacterium CG03_land_8_20_14_0_80_35_15]PIX07024.1 MAG: rod shape-determining protein MreC [Flavobacteriales bacterium CG_4_8_14_3_um_filter_35_10]PJA05942.1 MAG: rod shape-determining protein MreC [Flavobacteriales bacterium CG_4_1
MQHFFNFIVKYQYFLLFLLLETFAFSLTIYNNSYHKSVFINSTNQIAGGVLKHLNNFESYIDLKLNNQLLLKENTELKNKLEFLKTQKATVLDSSYLPFDQKYKYLSATVIRNEFTKLNNYLTIDKGTLDSVKIDLGVINEKGIIGVVNNTSKKYATVISILNQKSKINVKLKKTDYFGSLVWDGQHYNILQLIDLPRQALIHVGDTVVTGGQSTIFPLGIPVGRIQYIKTNNNYYTKIDIKLFNDMSAIGHVYLIINKDSNEIKTLENTDNIEHH